MRDICFCRSGRYFLSLKIIDNLAIASDQTIPDGVNMSSPKGFAVLKFMFGLVRVSTCDMEVL